MRETWLAWSSQPEYARIFVGYLIIVVSFSIIRAGRLIRVHYSLSKSKSISFNSLHDGSVDAAKLSDIALANKISHEPLPSSPQEEVAGRHTTTEQAALDALRMADSRFDFLWEKSYQAAKSMERLSLFTLLLSFLVFFYGLSWILRGDFPSEGNISLGVLLLTTIAQRAAVLVVGLAASSFVYILSSFFQGSLKRRQINWNRFYGSVSSGN